MDREVFLCLTSALIKTSLILSLLLVQSTRPPVRPSGVLLLTMLLCSSSNHPSNMILQVVVWDEMCTYIPNTTTISELSRSTTTSKSAYVHIQPICSAGINLCHNFIAKISLPHLHKLCTATYLHMQPPLFFFFLLSHHTFSLPAFSEICNVR